VSENTAQAFAGPITVSNRNGYCFEPYLVVRPITVAVTKPRDGDVRDDSGVSRPSLTTSGPTDESARCTRREILAGVATTGAVTTSGCTRRLRSLFGRDGSRQLQVTIKTFPTDTDPWAIRTARHLATNLDAVGVRARVSPTGRVALFRDVLVNQSFDMYVARLPAFGDPDYLRGLLHSRFSEEPGWQNPFGYADLSFDTLLEQQRRREGNQRIATLATIQKSVARNRPFSVVVFPDEIRTVRTDRLEGWSTHGVHTVLGYLSLGVADRDSRRRSRASTAIANSTPTTADRKGSTTPNRNRTTHTETNLPSVDARMVVSDYSVFENLNPVAVEYRDTGTVIGLLYDSIGRWIDGAIRPWLAKTWRWHGGTSSTRVSASPTPADDGPMLEVRLREDLTWHDGESLTASDIAFTYRFLQDTSLGEFESPVPAPIYRSRSSLVNSVAVVDERTVRIEFLPSSRSVALRSLTVPVLPSHIWREMTGRASIAGIEPESAVTEALIRTERNPIGSGPLRFASAAREKSVTLRRNDDHFLKRTDIDRHLHPYRGGFAFDTLQFVFAPSDDAAVSLVREGTADGTATAVTPSAVPQIGRDTDLALHTEPSLSCYHIGFNLQRAPYGNPLFRRAVAQLVDRSHLVDAVFDGYATPAVSPLAGRDTLAPELAWEGKDPVLPFPGADGQLDVDRGRDAFRQAGYRYSNDGRLVVS